MGDGNVQFFAGMEVVDVDGTKVGNLIRYDERLGYLETQGAFPGPRYIPFHAIESVKPAAIRLNVTHDVVSAVYRRMPDAQQLRDLRDRITEGTPVLDEMDQTVGTVEAYDRDTGYMRIDDGLVAPAPLFLPATAIGFVDDRGVHLNAGKDAIILQFTRVPEVAREALGG
ncbi:MAG: hypothetical protein ACJ8F1_12975 [Polyangia bacterium]